MNHGSLFSGIGGFDLAAQWMGWNNVFHVERDPFCRQVLAHHFPESQSFDDVKTFNATPFRGRVSVISGGFPCQPFSAAGKRAGTSDNRYLWPEMFRIIREARPTYVVAENVRGLISWNEGLVLDTVCADLEGEGYEVFPVVLPAASVNAPHRRDRIWIVAYRPDSRREDRAEQHRRCETPSREGQSSVGGCGTWSNAADATKACSMGWERRRSEETQRRQSQRAGLQLDVEGQSEGGNAAYSISDERPKRGRDSNQPKEAKGHSRVCDARSRTWENFPSVAPICGGDDGLPERLDGITFPKWRRESIKAYGNAIVPQVAYQIFKALTNVR
jgi:DNA (cytosine-5)-methyltransferase 1